MKRIVLMIFLFLGIASVWGQEAWLLDLDFCRRKARESYPLGKQQDLIGRNEALALRNTRTGYFPQLTVVGQSSVQSDVTKLPFELPGFSIPEVSKDQHRIYGELSQVLYDGGATRLKKESVEAEARIARQELEVELYKVDDRVTGLFLGILLVDQLLAQNEMMINDLHLGITRTEAAIAAGVALKSSLDVLKVELLKAGQHTTELRSTRKAHLDMLGVYMGLKLDERTILNVPPMPQLPSECSRPELKVYEYRKQKLALHDRAVNQKVIPKVFLFAQAGYGRPGFNMLSDDFDTYAMAGIRMSWPLTGFYTLNNEHSQVVIGENQVDLQKETFLFNLNLAMEQQREEISKLDQLIISDEEMITLRRNIKTTALAQLESGVITTNDYTHHVIAEDQAVQQKINHQVQRLAASYALQALLGYSSNL